jgi:ketopantoate reductase
MNTNQSAVVIGMGEMGGSFARGLLRLGLTVVPVLRTSDIEQIAEKIPEPAITLVTVGEADLDHALANLPDSWKVSTALIQNELLPRNWQAHDFVDPTVAAVWFEKKAGRSEKVIIPTPSYGPLADLLVTSLATIDVAAVELDSADDLLFELVRKNMYILTANIGGLITKDTVHDLWYNHRPLAQAVADDILPIQEWLTGATLDRDALIAGMVETFDADPGHGSTGRSAPARLARALHHADEAGLEVPKLREIQADLERASRL